MLLIGCACVLVLLGPATRGGSPSVADAAVHAGRALELAQEGRLAEAEAELRRAVDLAPANPAYLTDLGTVLAMEKKLAESAVFFTQALERDPRDLTARRYLAASLWQLHRPEEARRNLVILLKAAPDDRNAILLLGMVSEELKDYSTAARLLGSVPDLVGQRPESMAALARACYHTGRTAKARETLLSLLHHAPNPQGVFLGARIAAEMRDFDTAAKLYEAIRSTYPDRAVLGYNLALVQYQGKRVAEARQTLLDLLAAGYRSGEIDDLLGRCYQKQQQTEQALRAFEDAIRLEPAREENYLDLGSVQSDARRFTAALQTARRAVEAFPNSPPAYVLKGEAEFRLSQFTDAIASYSRAAQLDPSDPEASLGMAKAQAAAGMIPAARQAFESGIQRFPQDAGYHLEYALMLVGLADVGDETARRQAETQFRLALALDPGLAEAYYELGQLALAAGRVNEALPDLQAATRLGAGESKTHFALARAYRRSGRTADAAREMALFEKLKHQEPQRAAAMSPAGMDHPY